TTHFYLLPFVEQDNLYRRAGGNSFTVLGVVVPTYLSPSDFTTSDGKGPDGSAVGNYAANYRVFGNTATGSWDGMARIPGAVPDGTSNTLLFATKYGACGTGILTGGSYWAQGPFSPGVLYMPMFAFRSFGVFQAAPTQAQCNPDLTQSFGAGGIQVTLADGS